MLWGAPSKPLTTFLVCQTHLASDKLLHVPCMQVHKQRTCGRKVSRVKDLAIAVHACSLGSIQAKQDIVDVVACRGAFNLHNAADNE